MPATTRTQPFDPGAAFAVENEKERLDGLRSRALPRLIIMKNVALHDATNTFGFDVEQGSDELERVEPKLLEVGLHPADGDYSAVRGVRSPAFELKLSAVPDGIGVILQISGTAEWRLFVKTLYQHREAIGEYVAELEELYLFGEEDEEAVEELDQLFAVDVEGEHFKANGCRLYFPPLDYPIETEDDFDTLTGDFSNLFPLYWMLLKAALGEPVNVDRLLG